MMNNYKNPKLGENYDSKITAKLEERLKSEPGPVLGENSVSILSKRYLKKNDKGEIIENPADLFRRVASNIAYPEYYHTNDEEKAYETAKKFYNIMAERKFMPNSPTLMNAGRELQQLSACFVLPIKDSIVSIFGSALEGALVHQSGGGTGYSFSNIRPENSRVKSTKGIASGPNSFLYVHDTYTEVIKQGSTRRGANMGIMRIDHPDIEDFIDAKNKLNSKNKKIIERLKDKLGLDDEDAYIDFTKSLLIEGQLSNFNLSVAVTDKFMDAVEKDSYYELINPQDGKPAKKIKAKEIFDNLINKSWERGEPGIIFIDAVNKYNPTPPLGEMESTNPCGEQPLLPYEACNLGSINLERFVKDDKTLNYNDLSYVTKTGVRFLDNVASMSKFPLEEISNMVHGNRKIGLGVMGFADMLVKMDIAYDSQEGLDKADEVMKFIQEKADEASEELAKERGVFPNWEKSVYKGKKEIRNATRTTIAPTGTISIIAEASSAIEPYYGLLYEHTDGEGKIRNFVNQNLLEHLRKYDVDTEIVKEELIEGKSLQEIDIVPDDIKKLYKTANEIPGKQHVMMQAIFQKYTNNAVSKTVNFDNSATIEEVEEVFKLAYKEKCKGITIYREGSRDTQVLNKPSNKQNKLEKITNEKPIISFVSAKERPARLQGQTIRKKTGCGNIFVTVNYDINQETGEKELFEVFATMGKSGGCAAAQNEAVGRLGSSLLRIGADPKGICSQLIGIHCDKPYKPLGKEHITSCADAVGRTLAEVLGYTQIPEQIGDSENMENLLNENKITENPNIPKNSIIDEIEKKNRELSPNSLCPECGSPLIIDGGCRGGRCSNTITCGWSSCS